MGLLREVERKGENLCGFFMSWKIERKKILTCLDCLFLVLCVLFSLQLLLVSDFVNIISGSFHIVYD